MQPHVEVALRPSGRHVQKGFFTRVQVAARQHAPPEFFERARPNALHPNFPRDIEPHGAAVKCGGLRAVIAPHVGEDEIAVGADLREQALRRLRAAARRAVVGTCRKEQRFAVDEMKAELRRQRFAERGFSAAVQAADQNAVCHVPASFCDLFAAPSGTAYFFGNFCRYTR